MSTKDDLVLMFIHAYFSVERIWQIIKNNTIRFYRTKGWLTMMKVALICMILSALFMGTLFDAQNVAGPCDKESVCQSGELDLLLISENVHPVIEGSPGLLSGKAPLQVQFDDDAWDEDGSKKYLINLGNQISWIFSSQ